ncbi:MAG: WYL domain-containing protein [Ramlibacter sp.]|nr:WYL domain-containing protein [Ramlibacter sp.]
MEALGISKTAASTLLSDTVVTSSGLLVREGYKVIAPVWSATPVWIDETDLMESLDCGRTSFSQTGLRSCELPVSLSRWSSNLPAVPGALTTIVQACSRKRPVFVRYVGLRAGSRARFRRIFPLVLERMGDQWRLVAHDLEVEDFPLRVFVLSRITGAAIDSGKLPRGFLAASPIDFKKSVNVEWDLRLTADQIEALRNELNIDSCGKMMLNSRDEHEFLIRFGGQGVSPDILWPPLRKTQNSQ